MGQRDKYAHIATITCGPFVLERGTHGWTWWSDQPRGQSAFLLRVAETSTGCCGLLFGPNEMEDIETEAFRDTEEGLPSYQQAADALFLALLESEDSHIVALRAKHIPAAMQGILQF